MRFRILFLGLFGCVLFMTTMCSIGAYQKLMTYHYGEVVQARVIESYYTGNRYKKSIKFQFKNSIGIIHNPGAVFKGDTIKVRVLKGSHWYLLEEENPYIEFVLFYSVIIPLIICFIYLWVNLEKFERGLLDQYDKPKNPTKWRGKWKKKK